MDKSVFEKLQHCFIMVRFYHTNGHYDKTELDEVVNNLKIIKKQLNNDSSKNDYSLLVYCIDTLFNILNEGKTEKIFDFADAIHNIPEIFIGTRSLKSFKLEVNIFRKKYGKNYFSDFFSFNKKQRKKKRDNSDKNIGVWVFLGIIFLILPICLLAIMNFIFDAPGSAWVVIGYIGSFIVGVGFFNLMMKFAKLSIGIKFSLFSVLIGGALIAVSELLVFNSHLFNEDLVNYYFISLIFIIATLIFYAFFRGSVNYYLQNCKKISKTNINKHKKGKRNYWWYEEIHKEFGIGKIYYLNKIYTILFLSVFSLHLILGFFKVTSIITCLLSIILYVFSAIMWLFTSIQNNIEEHGCAFVLLAQRRNKGIDSSVLDLIIMLFFLGLAYAHIVITIGLWK